MRGAALTANELLDVIEHQVEQLIPAFQSPFDWAGGSRESRQESSTRKAIASVSLRLAQRAMAAKTHLLVHR